MTLRPIVVSAILAASTLGSSGCLFRKAKTPIAPVSTAPAPLNTAPAPVETATPQPAHAQPEPPPPAPPESVQIPVTQPPVQVQQPTPAPPRSPRPRPTQPATVPPPQPAAAPPAFGELLTVDQQARLLHACEQSAQAARRALNQAAGHSLNRDQLDMANRVRSFLKQADDAKGTDPSNAAQLARRAETLANSLLSSIQ